MTTYFSVTVRRVTPHIVEWTVTGDDCGQPVTATYHANTYATFHGPHTGNPAHQLGGPAKSPWRASDHAMLRALAQRYHTDNVNLAATHAP